MRKILRLLVSLAVVAGFLFVIYSHKRPTPEKAFFPDRAIVAVYHSVMEFYHQTTHSISSFIDKYFFLVGRYDENVKLKETIRLLEVQNRSLHFQLGQKTNDEKIKVAYNYLGRTLVRADILGFDPFSQARTLLIDGGRDKNFKINFVVITTDGLVGRVMEVFNRSSRVLLLIDNYFSVDTLNERTNLRCLVRGLNLNRLEAERFSFLSQVEFLQQGNELHEGDRLVTSGLSGIYPAGISVGTVWRVKYGEAGPFERSLVLPAVDFTKLKDVYVLVEGE